MDFYYFFLIYVNLYYKLMKKLGYDLFVILGYFMGGEIFLNLIYLYFEVVIYFILIDVIGGFYIFVIK